MRIGIAGAGVMGSIHGFAWQKTGAEITAVLDKNKELAAPLADKLGVPFYTDLKDMIPHIDVIDVCVPTFLHHPIVMESARNGIHVICEKPLARTLEQGVEMVRECRKNSVKLLPGHVLRFFPDYIDAREAVQRGDLGKLGLIRLSRESFAPRKSKDNWFLDYEKSGGILLDLCLHDLDYARWIAGEVTSVYAKTIKSDNPELACDHALVILEHKSGVLSHIQGSWSYPAPEFHTKFEIAGSRGLLTHNSDDSAPISLHMHAGKKDTAGKVAVPLSPLENSPYEIEIQAFYDHLEGDSPLPVKDSDALAALQIALAALESSKTGRNIMIPELEEVQS
ncbi:MULTISPECIES: Gfo/Idh/MocA family protein [unclassified Oceanispirochaeta]|uniref:Gfo/Idh/MocA family protein n=1 Tax=unclassified Oceanispirochaeta TaxID=2635722 RepID=UPI000E098E60|nr:MULTISPECIES: Gfo/Idh/MocA family oxidoreductase [unclassified Oceanispirochaeta]MBF9017224.1 Gfo/Idh/MocA family oxidoreductase [Oceanispirochaeta sp. M2]NPD73673.1 Gfo/Idh/MocA family oxidoreductase [Oceanispirochaeta sp. M1]RDG30603.1 gfo/Idh/MocA family oxidoreductase [Oceanispirochaeta sp. M1]